MPSRPTSAAAGSPTVSAPARGLPAPVLWLGTLFMLGLLAVFIVTPLDARRQFFLGGITVLSALVLARFANETVRQILILLSIGVSTRYLYWRFSVTLSVDTVTEAVLGGILLFAETYAYAMLVLGYVQSAKPLKRKPVPLPFGSHSLVIAPLYFMFVNRKHNCPSR